MIDCSKYNEGCEGGDVCTLLRWIKEEKVSIVTEKTYPLELADQTCRNVSNSEFQIQAYECDKYVTLTNFPLICISSQSNILHTVFLILFSISWYSCRYIDIFSIKKWEDVNIDDLGHALADFRAIHLSRIFFCVTTGQVRKTGAID